MTQITFDKDDLPQILRVRVTPKAKSERIKTDYDSDGTPYYRIYVTSAPENGKANQAVINLLSRTLKIPKSSLIITHGHTNRDKLIRIETLS